MKTKIGSLRVWWCPQIPMPAFHVDVSTVEEAAKLMRTLALYDLFQFNHKVKPDYANAGGLEEYVKDNGDGKPGWVDWHDPETDIEDPEEYVEMMKKRAK